MAYPRWYPTVTVLSDGRLIVTSGETNCNGCDETIQEIYDPSTNSWSQLSSAPFSFPYYPHVYLLPDGRILVAATPKLPSSAKYWISTRSHGLRSGASRRRREFGDVSPR